MALPTTINAIAVVPGVDASAMATASYFVNVATTTALNLTTFNTGSMLLVGSASARTDCVMRSLVQLDGSGYGGPVKRPDGSTGRQRARDDAGVDAADTH